jgi:hypothetical protein
MILVDFNQTLISNLMAQIGSNPNATLSEDLIRHIVLSCILSYKKKFTDQFGQLVFCSDDKRYWRRDVFQYYKANRKKARESSGFDWGLIFTTLNKIRDEIKENFPYLVIQVDGAEADDIIATLSKYSQTHALKSVGLDEEAQPVLILSGDKDFLQLQKYPNIRQYSPIQKKFLVIDDPHKYLIEHIIRGDSGDGIPNFLSADSVFVTEGVKQKSIMSKNLKIWLEAKLPEDFCNETMLRNYKRNELLIDLSKIPQQIENDVIVAYENGPQGDRKKLFAYFIKNRLKYLIDDLSQF